ncbi:MAG: lipoprotein [Candidatus Berkiella sp.]
MNTQKIRSYFSFGGVCAIVLLCSLLISCGQTGPLTLPDTKAEYYGPL